MKGISVYILSDASRKILLEEFTPRWKTFLGHHVTYQFGSSDKDPLPPTGQYYVIGYSSVAERSPNGSGIEALVVTINENMKRIDGNTYHITWSHGPGYSPKDSVELTAKGFRAISPIRIEMEPKFLPFN